jgi:hypothetical protein
MSIFLKISFIAIVGISAAFSMGGSSAGAGAGAGGAAGGLTGQGGSLSGLYQDVSNVAGLIDANSPAANQLRTNISMLVAKLSALGGSTPGQLVSATNAQNVSAAIDSVVNMILGTAALSSVQTVESIKGGISGNPYLQALFINQANNVSVWDAYMYPQILTAFIRIQASYASAILNYISQNIAKLTPGQIDSLNTSVTALLNRLNSIV